MRRSAYQCIKRIADVVISFLGIFMTSPIWLIAIIGIEISDPGPIFYRAMRVGKDNGEFIMWKFRSMRVPKKESEKSEASFKADTDRVFPFGAFCRRCKIDELPQLLNVLLGSMSLVGPRPAARDQAAVMRAGKYNVASTVKPGLTGPAALYDYICGDRVEDVEEYERLVLPTRLELEAYYPSHMSLGYDVKMIWYTVVCVLASVFNKIPKRILTELTESVLTDEQTERQEVHTS